MTIPHGMGTCPVCNGSKRVHEVIPEYAKKYGWYGYSPNDDMVDCTNCGAQKMYGKPSGMVRLNHEGLPCKHSYDGQNIGRCLFQYTCKHCGDSFQVDSGD